MSSSSVLKRVLAGFAKGLEPVHDAVSSPDAFSDFMRRFGWTLTIVAGVGGCGGGTPATPAEKPTAPPVAVASSDAPAPHVATANPAAPAVPSVPTLTEDPPRKPSGSKAVILPDLDDAVGAKGPELAPR